MLYHIDTITTQNFAMNSKHLISILIIVTATFLLAQTSSNAKDLKFQDKFEYVVNRDNDNKSTFTAHGWSGAKAENITGKGKGYLYTVDKIPGYSGAFPGENSKRVLAIEGRPSTFKFQTDFYLQYGGQYDNQLPGNVWFQFWIYINDYSSPDHKDNQESHFENNGKFIYPTKRGYPSKNGLWLFGLSPNSKEPFRDNLGKAPSSFYMNLVDLEQIKYKRRDGKTSWKLGQTNLDEVLKPNHWFLVKLHIDTSTTSGTYEQWLKPLGGEWTKIAEWIDNVTPGLSWKIPPHEVGGHRSFRMPTTANPCKHDRSMSCDFWIYLDDFVIAESEKALPVYK